MTRPDPSGAATLPFPRMGAPVGRSGLILVALGALVLAFMLLELAIGPVWIPIGTILDALVGRAVDRAALATIVWDLRLPRVLTAAFAGAALGLAGLQMQTLFRNPLADPWSSRTTAPLRRFSKSWRSQPWSSVVSQTLGLEGPSATRRCGRPSSRGASSLDGRGASLAAGDCLPHQV